MRWNQHSRVERVTKKGTCGKVNGELIMKIATGNKVHIALCYALLSSASISSFSAFLVTTTYLDRHTHREPSDTLSVYIANSSARL